MRRNLFLLFAPLTLVTAALAAPPVIDAPTVHWPEWRGPLRTGEAPSATPPLTWSESGDDESDRENIRWKVALPGRGHSTPVIAGDRVFLTAAKPIGDPMPPRMSGAPGAHDNAPITHRHEFLVLCVARETGKILWQKSVHEALPHEGAHYSASLASGSPITDGKFVYAYFGSYGLYCLDLDGDVVWKYMPGKLNTKHGHGEGNSPVLDGETIVINCDHEKRSFVVALNARTGEERWKKQRDEVTSWSSPIVVHHGDERQLIIAGTKRVRSYNLEDGEVIWECGGLSANVVATPVPAAGVGDGMVFVGSSYDTRAMFGVRLTGATGDITETDQVVWSRTIRTPYVPSPVLYRGRLHFLRHYQGIMTHVDAATGAEPIAPLRLNEIRNCYASPVAANGRIYVTSLEGVTVVIAAAKIPRVVAVNRLNEPISASAAFAENEMYLRGKKSLYCLVDQQPGT